MGIFSFLSSKKETQTKTESKDFSELFTKELLVDILNSSNTMMLLFSRSHGWIGANRQFYQVIGYKDISEFRENHDSVRDIFLSESEDIFTEDDRSWLDYIKKYKPNGYDVSMYDKNKNVLELSLKCVASPGVREVYILELEDVTKLHESNLKIQEVENLKTKFLSNIGHEFRTPMNGILGFLELLAQTNMDKKQEEYVQLIDRSSRNLMANIETLLDLAQMQSGRLTIDNADFEIIPQMEETLHNHIISAKDKGVKVLSFIDPKLPRELNGDVRKIKQIMNSLIQNAVKFTPRSGRVIVEIKLLKRQINGDCSIGFSVKDNGKGIPRGELTRILEPFNSGSHSDGRLGVGLSLSHGLVQLLGSELKIQSEENHGSYFNFVLDFKESKGQTYKMMPKKRVKVLLVDKTKVDEANFLSTYLRSFAIDVVKSNTLDEKVFDGMDALYIVANQNDSSWMLKLGTYSKKIPVVILLDELEKLKTKFTHVIDEVIVSPLFPSRVSEHLTSMHSIELREKSKEKVALQNELRALVVEDNLINQRLIKILLKEYNIIVSTASNGNEAIDLCTKDRFDIVFMDIDMPEKNGIVATKEIKDTIDLNGKTPIVALTALAMQGDREMILKSGLDDYLSKPLTREKLENILNKYLKTMLV